LIDTKCAFNLTLRSHCFLPLPQTKPIVMKKISIILIFAAFSCSVYGQNMPKEGYSGLGFNVTGLADVAFDNFGQTAISGAIVPDPLGILNGGFDLSIDALIPQNILMYKRYYADGLASRFTLGLNSLSAKSFIGDSTGVPTEYSTTEVKTSGFTFGIGIGLEKHMETESSKVDPYLGVDILFAMLTGINYTSDVNVTSENSENDVNTEIGYPGGIGFGLNLLGGFNYFFADNISIGGEVGLGFNMMSMGGEWTYDATITDTQGQTTTTTEISSIGEYKNSASGINVNSYGGVNLMIYW